MGRYSKYILMALFWASCKPAPVAPVLGVDRSQPVFQMIDYTRVRVFDNDAVSRSMDDIEKIVLGRVDELNFEEQVSLVPNITRKDNSYLAHFDTVVTIPDSGLTQRVRIRVYLKSGAFFDKDSTLAIYLYPYSSIEPIVLPAELQPSNIIQDIAFVRDTMYLLHIGDSKLYQRPAGESMRFYRNINEADFLAGDSCYVFIDNDVFLARFNVDSGAFDHSLRQILPPFLNGIAAENGTVYALYPNRILVLLDRQGVLLDSMEVPFDAFHIAVHQGVLFANDYIGKTIVRFDTKTKTLLPPLKAPVTDIEGLEIYQGYLYVGDYHRKILFRVPLQDMQLAGPPNRSLSRRSVRTVKSLPNMHTEINGARSSVR